MKSLVYGGDPGSSLLSFKYVDTIVDISSAVSLKKLSDKQEIYECQFLYDPVVTSVRYFFLDFVIDSS